MFLLKARTCERAAQVNIRSRKSYGHHVAVQLCTPVRVHQAAAGTAYPSHVGYVRPLNITKLAADVQVGLLQCEREHSLPKFERKPGIPIRVQRCVGSRA